MSKDMKFNFLNSDEQERYQKHLTLNEIGYEGQLSLKNSSVLCVGAGGLGSSVLLYLAATGIGKIGIVDNDHVEKSNLQRQIIHETNTIGKLKIDSARERIKKFNPNSELLTFAERINPKNALKMIREFDKRRKIMIEQLNEIKGFECSNSKGAFYLFPSIKKTGLKSNDMENILLNKIGIAAVSGNSFGKLGEGYIRFSYANSEKNIKLALKKIKEYSETTGWHAKA